VSNLFVRAKNAIFRSRKAPARTATQAKHVRDRKYGGSTKAMATAYGVAPRTVSRWIDGTRHPVKFADRLRDEAAAVQVTDRGRERKAKQLAKKGTRPSGISTTVSRARTFQIRGSNAVRQRDIDLDLTGEQAAALARATTDDEAAAVLKGAMADYFNGGAPFGGFRPDDFDFDPGDVDYRGL
jgi:hypothetical protein